MIFVICNPEADLASDLFGRCCRDDPSCAGREWRSAMQRMVYAAFVICIYCSLSFFVVGGLSLCAQESPLDKDVWDVEDVKKFLKLPYAAQFDKPAQSVNLSALAALAGVSGMAILPEGSQVYEAKGAALRICSSDLSVFDVSISRPESCVAACDMILQMSSELVSVPKKVVGCYAPSYDDASRVYTLIDRENPRLWCLNVGRGILVYISYDAEEQVLRAPANRDVLLRQIGLAIDALVEHLDADARKEKDKRDEHYRRLVAAYTEARSRDAVGKVSGDAKFDLLLSHIPAREQEDRELRSVRGTEKVIAGVGYLLSMANGGALPPVKMADCRKVSSENTLDAQRGASGGITDVCVQQTFEGAFQPAEAILRSDGRYQVKLHGLGKQMLRVLFLDGRNIVVRFGQVAIDVVDGNKQP